MTDREQRRRPPAYQVYPSDDLARATYYRLSLAERGLVEAMRRVIWCDDGIVADPDGIALAVRRPVAEVKATLTAEVLAHFALHPNDSSRLVCTELARQMTRLLDQRAKQSAAAARTNENKNKGKGHQSGDRSAKRGGKRHVERDGDGGAPEQNRTESNRSSFVKEDDNDKASLSADHKEFIDGAAALNSDYNMPTFALRRKATAQ